MGGEGEGGEIDEGKGFMKVIKAFMEGCLLDNQG
jgi:hypothetical protein